MIKALGYRFEIRDMELDEWVEIDSITAISKFIQCSRQHVYDELANGKGIIYYKGKYFKVRLNKKGAV